MDHSAFRYRSCFTTPRDLTRFINVFRSQYAPADAARATFLLDYPTAYIIHNKSTNPCDTPSSS
ncbi:hypothetical protein ATN04_11065 [Corynebacterium pseudotuberculosis]|nr:hypothetical protein ATN04_11065 [Corynebacterium pseudotuberculosis]